MCTLLLKAAAAATPRTSLRLLRTGLAAMSTAGPLKSVDYEVFGRVQGVCFRMYTEGEAKKIGVVGWVKNTSQGTVTGQVQGPEEKVNSIPLPFGLPGQSAMSPAAELLELERKTACWSLWTPGNALQL
ncbi:acylphosphatase-2 isoform X1 [Desmodus rotundus]|uniref:acylphosphatase-2 isoform X1 n=1 Tax=Desmodus rotundus TaxID=9430 RepID=UPI001E1BEA66|nr:acylphosphatase-2 isoform X1 [Desmodus rotundus]